MNILQLNDLSFENDCTRKIDLQKKKKIQQKMRIYENLTGNVIDCDDG